MSWIQQQTSAAQRSTWVCIWGQWQGQGWSDSKGAMGRAFQRETASPRAPRPLPPVSSYSPPVSGLSFTDGQLCPVGTGLGPLVAPNLKTAMFFTPGKPQLGTQPHTGVDQRLASNDTQAYGLRGGRKKGLASVVGGGLPNSFGGHLAALLVSRLVSSGL
uniref:Uncharacterized protein n=1 Tax=Rhinopithecus roxellana TaxID=61622 RepID=A0A2K6R7K5_RHIRO